MSSPEQANPENLHTHAGMTIRWITMHMLDNIAELPTFGARHGLDIEAQARLRDIYERTLIELGQLPQDETLLRAIEQLHQNTRDDRDQVMGIQAPPKPE